MEARARNNLLGMVLLDALDDSSDDSSDSSDDYDEDEDPVVLINIEAWRRTGDPEFQRHFRMDRDIFEELLLTVGRHMVQTGRIVRRGTAVDLSLMMTLWILASNDTFRSVGVKFGVKEGSVHNHYRLYILILTELRDRFIRWPSRWEKQEIAHNFEEQFGYPGVLGCIDGTHIRVTKPLEQPRFYFNWHRDYSILVQAVCDNRLLFRDIFVGQPGSVGDARTFQRSQLGERLLRRIDITDDLHLLGDGAYPLTSKLIVPYRNYGHMTRRQRTHNYFLSRCRASIERAFALLKGKWRRLKYFHSYCLQYANEHITACLVLHNFIILNGEQYEDDDDEGVFVPAEVTDEELLAEAQLQGEVKREYIATLLFLEE